MKRSAIPLFLFALAGSASAQFSTSTASIVGVANSTVSGGLTAISQTSGNGAISTLAGTASYTGLNRSGATQTMTFSGSTVNSAQYGQLHAYAAGTLTNSYYNASNPVYTDGVGGVANANGSPDSLASLGFSDFDDTLQFGGALQSGYQARYIFHVDGTNSGDGGFADLAVKIGSDPDESFFSTTSGYFEDDWATVDHSISGQTPQMVHVQFSNQVVFNTPDLTDGMNDSGISDFSATLTLAAIEIVDANGNPVTGVTATSASGTRYNVLGAPVPEPASLLAVAFGLVPILRRRSRKG